MSVEILQKQMPVFRTEHDFTPTGTAPVWTPVQSEIILASGIARWRVVGGIYDGYILYVTKSDRDIFMTPGYQGKNGTEYTHY